MPEATDFIYNGLQLVVDGLVLFVVARAERVRAALSALGIAASFSLLLILALSSDLFHFTRLLSFAVFAHAPLVLGATGWVRRGVSMPLSLGCAVGALALLLTAANAFLVEPFRLEVSRVEVEAPQLASPLRIVVVADFQTDRIDGYERRVLERAMALEPDLVLMPGDYVHASAQDYGRLAAELRDLFERTGFEAPLGVFAVQGNVERPGWPGIFEGTGVRPLTRTTSLRVGPLQLTGLELRDSFDPTLHVPAAEGFHVVFGHAPDYALGDIEADLLVAGHTHGGQVRIPFWGPIITFSRVPRSWAAGVTRLSGDRTLVVSRGIGMERGRAPRLRFLCRPEIVTIDLIAD